MPPRLRGVVFFTSLWLEDYHVRGERTGAGTGAPGAGAQRLPAAAALPATPQLS